MHTKQKLKTDDSISELPLVILYLTEECNSRCIMCYSWRNKERMMSMDMLGRIAGTLEKLDVHGVLLSGGEPMLHPQWSAIAQRIRSSGIYMMLATNGLMLKKQSEAILANVDMVIVSLDAATPETYRFIRGLDSFYEVIDGIRKISKEGLSVVVRTTVQRSNYRELHRIIDITKNIGASRISFLPVDIRSTEAFGKRFDSNKDNIMKTVIPTEELKEFSNVLDEIEADYSKEFDSEFIGTPLKKLRLMTNYFGAISGKGHYIRPRCNAPYRSIVIESDGSLRSCFFLPSWGSLGKRSLQDALNDRGAISIRKEFRQGKRQECEFCVSPHWL